MDGPAYLKLNDHMASQIGYVHYQSILCWKEIFGNM